MRKRLPPSAMFAALLIASCPMHSPGQTGSARDQAPAQTRPHDPAAEATAVRGAPADRPEQRVTDHDRSDAFDPRKPAPVSNALKGQPKEGRITGFDFARDPLNANKPFTTFEEVKSNESASRTSVTAAQRKLLESRYDLTPKPHPQAQMSRGKPLPVGPTARLPEGMTFEKLAALSPDEIKER